MTRNDKHDPGGRAGDGAAGEHGLGQHPPARPSIDIGTEQLGSSVHEVAAGVWIKVAFAPPEEMSGLAYDNAGDALAGEVSVVLPRKEGPYTAQVFKPSQSQVAYDVSIEVTTPLEYEWGEVVGEGSARQAEPAAGQRLVQDVAGADRAFRADQG